MGWPGMGGDRFSYGQLMVRLPNDRLCSESSPGGKTGSI
jgi:hypothetical protein